MKKITNKLLLLSLLALIAGCKKNYLYDGSTTEGPITEAQVWGNDSYARGVLNDAYFHIPEGFNLDGDGAMLASGSDEAVNSNANSSVNIFNNGTWSPVRSVDNVFSRLYEGLRKVNLFMVNAPAAAIIPQDGLTQEKDIERLRGEAFFLRGLFHFELMKRYGAIPLATRVFKREEDLNLPKNTYQECVDHVAADCDSAIAMLPTWTQSWSTAQRGRATKMAALALKSRLYLYAASPLNNPAGNTAKWELAASAAKALIDSNKHSLLTSYYNIFNYGSAQYNNEVIFATRAQNRNDLEMDNAPVSYDGAKGRTNPTQEFVDAFEMTNGKAITATGSGYNPNNPYNNRDPRLKIVVNYNGLSFKGRAVQTFVGGADGLNKNVNATRTGYYMRKFLSEAVTWNQASNTNARRPWVVFRYAEILLNYAEALNELGEPASKVLPYINSIRQRTGINMPALQTTNASGNGYVAPTKEAIRARIQNERRVELCFEGHRFFDVRRGKLYNTDAGPVTIPVTGMRITLNPDGTLNYERFNVENRTFYVQHYLYPFSQSTINLQPAIIQNPNY